MADPARTCDSCGRDDDDLAPVRRVYVVLGPWDEPGPGRVDVEDGVERWCFPCRTSYPHQEVAPPSGW